MHLLLCALCRHPSVHTHPNTHTQAYTQKPFECNPWSHDKTIIKEALWVWFLWFQIQNHALVLWLSKRVLWPQDSQVSHSSQNSMKSQSVQALILVSASSFYVIVIFFEICTTFKELLKVVFWDEILVFLPQGAQTRYCRTLNLQKRNACRYFSDIL